MRECSARGKMPISEVDRGSPYVEKSNNTDNNTMATILGLGASGETMFPYTSSQSSPRPRTKSPPTWPLGALALVG